MRPAGKYPTKDSKILDAQPWTSTPPAQRPHVHHRPFWPQRPQLLTSGTPRLVTRILDVNRHALEVPEPWKQSDNPESRTTTGGQLLQGVLTGTIYT